MNDRPARKVHDAHLGQPAALSPDPVADRRVDEKAPQQGEQHERLETLTFGEGADDQGWSDDGEHHLEQGEGCRRHRARVRTGFHTDALQADVVEVADDAPTVYVLAEGEGVADQHPCHAHQREDEHALHQDAEHVLAANEAAVEEREARGHQHDERRRRQYPGGVASIHDRDSLASPFATKRTERFRSGEA